MRSIMAQLASDTNSDGNNALLTHNAISNRSGFTPQPHADPSIPSEIFISPSRSRAMTESEVQKTQKPKHEKPKFASLRSPSCETRQVLYTWQHPLHKDPEMPKDQGSTSKPRYVEKASYADGDSDPEPEGNTTPTWEWGRQLTPLTNTSSESEYCEPQKALASDNPNRDVRPKPEEFPIHSPMTSEAIQDAHSSIKVDDWQSKGILPSGCSSCEDDDLEDDEYELFESEDDSFEERWVSTDKEFEATVLHATGNDFSLAARLIPQLYEMFRQEESSVVGFWEMCYRQRVGNSHAEGPGDQGGRSETRRSYASTLTSQGKRPRENDEGDDEGADNKQDGDKNDGNTEEHVGSPNAPPFACPFNKKYPSFYNGLHRAPDTRKGEYKTCQLGYDTEQRFKEHLSRLHRCVQCEKCSQKFTGPIKTRQVNFQKHLSLGDCRNAPPDILEGLTELQWAEIEVLPSQPRSAAAIGKPKARKLTVIRWNDVWKIIFPGENPPTPWCIPITEKVEDLSSSLEEERAQFKACFDYVINQENENLSLIDKAAQAFELWWAKWQVKQESSRQTQHKLAQMTLQEIKKTPTSHTRDEQSLLNEPIPSPNIKPPQRRPKIPKFQSHQEPLQNSPNGLEVQNMRSPTRRTSSDPHTRYQGYRPIAMPSQVSPTQMLTEFTQPSGQNTKYPSQDLNPMMTYGGIEQPAKAFSKTQSSFLGFEYPESMAIEGFTNFQSTSGDGSHVNTTTNVGMSRASHFQQPDPFFVHLQPQFPGHLQVQLQPQGVQHPQALISHSNTTHDQTYGFPPMQSPQATLPYSNTHPPQNFPQEESRYDDGYD